MRRDRFTQRPTLEQCEDRKLLSHSSFHPGGANFAFGVSRPPRDCIAFPSFTTAIGEGDLTVGISVTPVVTADRRYVRLTLAPVASLPEGGTVQFAQLTVPARYNFMQGYIYRLELTNIPNNPGLVLYPTIEVAPSTPTTTGNLTHSPIPVQFTAEDIGQVIAGNFVTKVVYLPDPRFQE